MARKDTVMTDSTYPASPVRTVCYADGHDLDGSRAFYTEVLGLDVAMEEPVLGLISAANPTAQVLIPPPGFEEPQPRFGIDLGHPRAVDAAHRAAVRRGLRVVYPLRTEPWGVRRFFVEDPGGTIINVLAHIGGAASDHPAAPGR
jgi:catechol 2,3-dioxygenase-like lactoylglutathione lyase family enzyme